MFADRKDLILLVIDPRKVDAEVVFENGNGRMEPFPHLYGPLPLEAVESVWPLRWLSERASYEFPKGWDLSR